MILLIDNTKAALLDLSVRFYHLGLPTAAVGARGALPFLKEHTVDAVLLPNADQTAGASSLCRRIREAFPTLPLVVALPKEKADALADKFLPFVDNILLSPVAPIHAAETVFEICRLKGGRDLSDLHAGPLILNLHLTNCCMYTVPVTVSINELLILRYLGERYPEAVPTEELAAFCGNPATKRKTGSVRMHISSVNRLSKKAFGTPIILYRQGKGYTLSPLLPTEE